MLKEIYRRIVQQEALTKPELAHQLEISLTTVSEYVNQLERLGWVQAVDKAESTGGRRAQRYSINPEKRLILGVDIRQQHAYLSRTQFELDQKNGGQFLPRIPENGT